MQRCAVSVPCCCRRMVCNCGGFDSQGLGCVLQAGPFCFQETIVAMQQSCSIIPALAGGGWGPRQGCGGAAAAGHLAREDAGAEAGAAGHLLHPHGRPEVRCPSKCHLGQCLVTRGRSSPAAQEPPLRYLVEIPLHAQWSVPRHP